MITSIEPQIALQDDIETALNETEVDAITDDDFGSLCRLWYGTNLLGTFYRKIFTDDWIATPVNSIEPYHCPSEDDAKYWLVADYLQLSSSPIPSPQSRRTTNSFTSVTLAFLFLLCAFPAYNSYNSQIEVNAVKALIDCTYRGSSRREDCLHLST